MNSVCGAAIGFTSAMWTGRCIFSVSVLSEAVFFVSLSLHTRDPRAVPRSRPRWRSGEPLKVNAWLTSSDLMLRSQNVE